jgi:hypothetical protein
MPEKYDVFLSYTAKDREWVRRLANALLEQGLNVWYDEIEIKPGDVWRDQTEKGLRASTYVVMVITPEAAHSNWQAAELGAALALQKPLIPIVAEDVPSKDIPGPIRMRKYLLKADPAVIADEIARGIASEREVEGRAGA